MPERPGEVGGTMQENACIHNPPTLFIKVSCVVFLSFRNQESGLAGLRGWRLLFQNRSFPSVRGDGDGAGGSEKWEWQ